MADITQRGQLIRDDSNFPMGWNYKNMTGTTATPTIVKASPGFLGLITFNAPTATSVITLYDSASAATGTFGIITVPASPQPITLHYDVAFNNGLVVGMGTANSNIIISYV